MSRFRVLNMSIKRTTEYKFISVKRKHFGKANSKALFLILALVFCLGIMGVFLNWKIGLFSIGLIAVAYFLLKNDVLKITAVLFITVLGLFGISHFLKLDFLELFLTTLFLSFSFFLNPLYESTKEDNAFELFFLDERNLKCLATKRNDYKGYAFNPKHYLKTYPAEKITSFTFTRNYLSISIGSEIIRPRELTNENLTEINAFVKRHFPNLLDNNGVFEENLKAENKFYIHKFLIVSPIIFLSTVIYFFGDNGRNEMVTYTSLLLMIVLPIIIYKLVRPK